MIGRDRPPSDAPSSAPSRASPDARSLAPTEAAADSDPGAAPAPETGAVDSAAAAFNPGSDAERFGPVHPGARRLDDATLRERDGGFWVFGYGSLMWRPGFPYQERHAAVLHGFARRFCIWSHHYRGTPDRPGLVLALAEEAGAETRGVAYRVAAEHMGWTRDYLAVRELVSAVYYEAAEPLRLLDGSHTPRALCYVADPAHDQFAPGLSLERQAEVIAAGHGKTGANCDYLFNTVTHLRDEGMCPRELAEMSELEAMVRARLSGRAAVDSRQSET